MQFTTLQPNISQQCGSSLPRNLLNITVGPDTRGTLRLMASKDAPVGVIDADDVGAFTARLLSQEYPSEHNKARYVLNGPKDITGQQIEDMVEQHIGTQAKEVIYKDTPLTD